MAYVQKLFKDNFLYYASYVIKDRAIPDEADGLKPVQRRILHSLFEMDDGKFHKVANVVGHCMKYHPHGDQSIYGALVVLANKGLFIDRQGNFGNLFTGDEASASRYIECRVTPLAKDILYNPKITDFEDSYDGRNREPVAFPAKLPVGILLGAEGIAVGMSTRILPHNPPEVIDAEIAHLRGSSFSLMPDFPTGGSADCADYQDGNGKVRVRARFDTSDPKRIVITELPFGSTTESLIESVEAAARAGRIKIASISDFTTEKVEIEIRLQRGVYAEEVIDSLYAFTECEQSIPCSCLLIREGHPIVSTISEVVKRHSESLLRILEAELRIEAEELAAQMHARTLERIFIEQKIYSRIEAEKTQAGVTQAVRDGLAAFAAEIGREVTEEDIERLLKIPIRRISLYDISKAREEMKRLLARLKEVKRHLAHLVDYAVDFLTAIRARLEPEWPRRTMITSFTKVEAKAVAKRDIALRYDPATGYLGTAVTTGERLFEVSAFDRILVLRRSGIYTVLPVPDKLFVDQNLLHCAIAEKERIQGTLMSLVYRDTKTGFPFIKRCRIEAWILNKNYSLAPADAEVLAFSVDPSFAFTLAYVPKARLRTTEQRFVASRYAEKGLKAAGLRLATRQVLSVRCEPEPGVAAIVAAAQMQTVPDLSPSDATPSVPPARKIRKPADTPKADPEPDPDPDLFQNEDRVPLKARNAPARSLVPEISNRSRAEGRPSIPPARRKGSAVSLDDSTMPLLTEHVAGLGSGVAQAPSLIRPQAKPGAAPPKNDADSRDPEPLYAGTLFSEEIDSPQEGLLARMTRVKTGKKRGSIAGKNRRDSEDSPEDSEPSKKG